MLAVRSLAKGQIVIPVELRRRFGIKPGSMLEIRGAEDHIEIYMLPADPIKALRGSLKGGPSMAEALIREHREEVRRDVRKRASARKQPPKR